MSENKKSSLTTKDMIIYAIGDLNDRKGSTIPSIKKYLIEKYDVSQARMSIVTKLLRTAGEDGWLIQTAGIGASSGSHFKLNSTLKKEYKSKIDSKNDIAKKNETKTKRQPVKPKADLKPAKKEVPVKTKKNGESSNKKVTSATKK